MLVPGSVGRLAIALARRCVFGADVMAIGRVSEEGMQKHITVSVTFVCIYNSHTYRYQYITFFPHTV